MSGHMIVLTLTRDGVDAEFSCHEPDTAPCRRTCTQPACKEDGCADPDGHETEPLGYCSPTEWLSNDDAYWYEMYVGQPVDPRTGKIDITWSGHGCEWTYS